MVESQRTNLARKASNLRVSSLKVMMKSVMARKKSSRSTLESVLAKILARNSFLTNKNAKTKSVWAISKNGKKSVKSVKERRNRSQRIRQASRRNRAR